jgi:hypothetical protein
MSNAAELHAVAAADADRPMVVPEVDEIIEVLTQPPKAAAEVGGVWEPGPIRLTTSYIEREARNRSLGSAGEPFVINYERARLIQAGKDPLAARIEHTSKVRGDHEGYDILLFDVNGEERLIEVKTTKYGIDTPFWVSKNEVATSERRSLLYHVYRLYVFRAAPVLYTLPEPSARAATFQRLHLSRCRVEAQRRLKRRQALDQGLRQRHPPPSTLYSVIRLLASSRRAVIRFCCALTNERCASSAASELSTPRR